MCATSKELLAVVVQVSHRVKAGLLQSNSTTPFTDTDAYVASSDVSLAGYICTHVCLIYVLQRDSSLASSSAWTSKFSLLPQLRSCASAGLVDSQASQPFSFIDVCTQTC